MIFDTLCTSSCPINNANVRLKSHNTLLLHEERRRHQEILRDQRTMSCVFDDQIFLTYHQCEECSIQSYMYIIIGLHIAYLIVHKVAYHTYLSYTCRVAYHTTLSYTEWHITLTYRTQSGISH